MDVEAGRVSAAATDASADIELADRAWAAVASGDLPVDDAVRLGLLSVSQPRALDALRALGDGPAPWCGEYF